MVIEFARNVCGLAGANSREVDSATPHPVIDLMDEQREVVDMGGTMRLGAYPARLRRGLAGRRGVRRRASSTSGTATATRSTRATGTASRSAGLWCSGTSPDDRLVEFIELPGHPYWVGTQAHPEFKSRPDRAAPAVPRARRRRPRAGRGPGAAPARALTDAFQLALLKSGRSTVVWRGSVSVRRSDSSSAPDGEEFERDIVHHPGAVSVVPLVDDGTVLLVRQYRAAIDARAARDPGGQARRGGRAARASPRAASWRRRSGCDAGTLEHARHVLQLARLLRRVLRHVYLARDLTAVAIDAHGHRGGST